MFFQSFSTSNPLLTSFFLLLNFSISGFLYQRYPEKNSTTGSDLNAMVSIQVLVHEALVHSLADDIFDSLVILSQVGRPAREGYFDHEGLNAQFCHYHTYCHVNVVERVQDPENPGYRWWAEFTIE